MNITETYQKIREEIPDHVAVVAAAKTRSAEEVAEIIDAGAVHIGENYVQEAERMRAALGERAERVTWHMIGHLQKNKINKALPVFDVIQTVDSLRRARDIDTRAERAGKEIIPVYIEINIGNESSKNGMRPEEHEPFEDYMVHTAEEISQLEHIRLEGLMTMGPYTGDPELSRPYFRRARKIFESLQKLDLPGADIKTLSMGMTHSYRAAVEEGSTMVRIGTALFGRRA